MAVIDTRRCMTCGQPNCDHTPVRYVLRVWVRHHLWSLINRLGRA